MGCSKSSSKRVVYSNTSLPQETRKTSNKQSNLTPKGTREKEIAIHQEMTQMTELVEKDTKICMIMIFSMLTKLKGRLKMLGRDKEDYKKDTNWN